MTNTYQKKKIHNNQQSDLMEYPLIIVFVLVLILFPPPFIIIGSKTRKVEQEKNTYHSYQQLRYAYVTASLSDSYITYHTPIRIFESKSKEVKGRY